MKEKVRLVMATNNASKLREARAIAGNRLELLSLEDIGCHDDIQETAPDLRGNALLKARHIKEHYGFDCFADDTGLMVDALGGAPGVHTARYAGEACDPEANIAKLLKELGDKADRTARFATVIALVQGDKELTFEGTVEGSIAMSPSGKEGFGYDPIFIPDESGVPFAEMNSDAKNSISHRGRAMRKLMDYLQKEEAE